MKIKVLGFLIMLAGLSLIAYGISFLSVADTETSAAPETPSPPSKQAFTISMQTQNANL